MAGGASRLTRIGVHTSLVTTGLFFTVLGIGMGFLQGGAAARPGPAAQQASEPELVS